jgi:hypothetical protein
MIDQFWDEILASGTNALANVAWDGVLKPKIAELFGSLQGALQSIWKDGEASWGRMIAVSYGLMNISGKNGKKAQKGSLIGGLAGLALAYATGGMSLAGGFVLGSSIGGVAASGGDALDIAGAGIAAYAGYNYQGGAQPASGGNDKQSKSGAGRSVNVTVNQNIDSDAVAKSATDTMVKKLERVINTGT